MNIPLSTAAAAPDTDLLTVPETARLLRLQISTIRAWVLQRRVPFVKLGNKRVLFRRADIDALLTASLVPAASSGKGAGR